MDFVVFHSAEAADHLACDELLLGRAESGDGTESLRFWETAAPVVVMGIGARWRDEVRAEACRADGVPLLRRCSGGGSVVLARGCLNYSLVLDTERCRAMRGIRASYGAILGRLVAAFGAAGVTLTHEGLSDLAAGGRKIGGSAQKRKRRFILHHGTLLYAFDAALLGRCLAGPPRPPDYRAGRAHGDFVANLDLPAARLRRIVAAAFDLPAEREPTDLTAALAGEVAALVAAKYARDEWTFRR